MRLAETLFDLPVEHALAGGDGGGRLRPDRAAKLRDASVEPFGRGDPVDEAAGSRRLRVDEFAGEEHLERLLAGHVAAERHARGRAEEAVVDAVDRDPGLGARHREVAGREELAAGRRRETVHPRHHRLGKAHDAEHHPAAPREQRLLERLIPVGVHLLQVVPRAERTPRSGQDHHADGRIGGDPVQRGRQGADHRLGERIEALRAIEGQGGHPLAGGFQEVRVVVVHLVSLGWQAPSALHGPPPGRAP